VSDTGGTQNPIVLIARAIGLWLRGLVRFGYDPHEAAIEDRQERFEPFRKVAIDCGAHDATTPGAIFQVRFRFKNLSPVANRLLSLIPIPLIVAQPGFRSKTWLLGNESGDFIGYYEFDSIDEAGAYWDSLPLRMMRRRAAPGTLTKKVESAAS